MISDISRIKKLINIEIAGIFLSINLAEVNVLDILNPLYRLFLVKGNGQVTNELDIHIREDQPETLANDLHPELEFTSNLISLNFQTGKLIINIKSRSSTLFTSMDNLAIELEYSLRILYAYFVLQYGGVLMHAAGIVRNGKGYVFCGPSGVGKSTVVKLSRNLPILNDDLIVIMPGKKDDWAVCATPFANPGQIIKNLIVPLQGIYLLEQSNEVLLEEISPGKSLAELIANVPVISGDIYRSDRLLATSVAVLRNIPFQKLRFRPDPSFWDLIVGN